MKRSTLSFRSLFFGEVEIHSFVVLMLSSASRKGARLEAPCICTSLETRCFAALVRMRLLGVLQSQYRLRDDVLLNLVRAAVDRDLARVEISRRDRRGPIGADGRLVPSLFFFMFLPVRQ